MRWPLGRLAAIVLLVALVGLGAAPATSANFPVGADMAAPGPSMAGPAGPPPAPGPAAPPPAPGPAGPPATPGLFRMNLARSDDFVAQTNFVQCVGASIQMMLNIERPGADRTARTQARLQRLARARSGPTPWGIVRRGAGIRGWAAALSIQGGGSYRIVGASSLAQAMRIAATAIRTWNRPVGLLVWRGRHAWVMSGFVATADPSLTDTFRVTRAYILDPLYPHGSTAWGPSPRPGTAVTVAAVGRQFVRRRLGGPWNALPGMARLAGKYVLLVPSGPLLPAAASRSASSSGTARSATIATPAVLPHGVLLPDVPPTGG